MWVLTSGQLAIRAFITQTPSADFGRTPQSQPKFKAVHRVLALQTPHGITRFKAFGRTR